MIKSKKIRLIRIIVIAVLVLWGIILAGFISPLRIKKYDLTFDNLPEEMDGYRIVQITDFHCKEFGDHEEDLIKLVAKAKPDVIFLTGDIVDEKHTVDNADDLLVGITKIAPVYYVTGNHEYYTGAPYYEFRELCDKYGVVMLENETVDVEFNGISYKLTGLDYVNSTVHMKDVIGYANTDYFNVLLYHDSSKFNFLSEYGYDIEFAGHGHGGLIRLPFIGGLLGSDYRLFPKYDYGIFHEKNSTMVTSSGLGDARVPRWNNPREIVLVKLHCEK